MPTLYFDLASPFGYLAVARAERVLGPGVELEPVLLGAIFGWRGWGSWAHTPARDEQMREVERRAAAYGLPLAWPPNWPMNSLVAMRAATWAKQQGATAAFAHEVYRRHFGEGQDMSGVDVLADAASAAGLPGGELAAAVASPAIKDELRRATTAAWEAGVQGVPTAIAGGVVFYGDDQLERAAAA